MLRIYQRLWLVNWAEQWQYRANLLMYLLYWIVSPIVYLAVWITIANSQGSVDGLTANDFVTYYLTLLVIDQLTSEITIHILAYKIQDGTLSNELLRPVHPILTSTLMYNIAFKALCLIGLVPIWLLLAFLFRPNFSAVTPESVLLTIPAVVIGFAISFLLGAAITCLAFWTTRVDAISQFYYAFIVLFSGQFVPLQLMPRVVQDIAQYLPFQMFKYTPIQILLNRMPLGATYQAYGVGLIWLAAAVLLFNLVWKSGVRRFSAVGA